jgi:hypothetical protein
MMRKPAKCARHRGSDDAKDEDDIEEQMMRTHDIEAQAQHAH